MIMIILIIYYDDNDDDDDEKIRLSLVVDRLKNVIKI